MITASNNVRLRTIGLYNAMGIDPERDIDIEDVLSSPIAIPTMEQALAESIKNRPEMLKADADIEAAQARVKAEESNYYPTLSANGSIQLGARHSGNGHPHPVGSAQRRHPEQLERGHNAVTVPVRRRAHQGKVSEARANLRALEAQGRIYRQSILLELNQAYADIESAAARIAVMELSVKKAQENLELAQGRYESGSGALYRSDRRAGRLGQRRDRPCPGAL